MKRLVDISVALVLLVFFSPVWALVLCAGFFDKGPTVFSHVRVGFAGRKFNCFKFRTMVVNAEEILEFVLAKDDALAEEWARDHKLRQDPRITWFGNFLRKTSLDELPQLLNVLRGDMSLVGPRPVTAEELVRYGWRAHLYVSVKPGLTGLWQVSGRNHTTYSRRVALDSLYVRRRSFLLDVWIFCRTVRVVLTGHGAH